MAAAAAVEEECAVGTSVMVDSDDVSASWADIIGDEAAVVDSCEDVSENSVVEEAGNTPLVVRWSPKLW